ncbi:MAG: peptidase inhibitor family I36 protein, partial [Oleiharenicola lentus]
MKNLFYPGLASLLLVTAVLADERDHDDRRDNRREGPRVILYQHAGFSGGSLVLHAGESIENMAGATFDNGAKLNDSVSSLRVEGDVEVYAYENARYRGEALRLTENARDLSGRPFGGSVSASWNDRISAIKIERVRGRD